MAPNMMDSSMIGGGNTTNDIAPAMMHPKNKSHAKAGRRQKHKGAKRGHSKRIKKG